MFKNIKKSIKKTLIVGYLIDQQHKYKLNTQKMSVVLMEDL